MLPRLQAAINGAIDQQCAQPASLLARATSKAPQAKAGHGVAGQLLAVGGSESHVVHLGGTERVVAEDLFGPHSVCEDADRADTVAAMLLGKAADAVVQRRHATLEPLAIMNREVERHVLKHAGPCGVLA